MPETEIEENISLKDLLLQIKNSKDEIKNWVSATEVRLLLEIQTLKNKNEVLEKENEILKERLERTEQYCNKNNIIIFGLNKSKTLSAEYLCEEINRLMKIQIEPREINDYYTLGKVGNSPIKVEFISYQSKKYIYQHTKELKGTGVSIANDLTLKQRQELKKLKSFLIEVRSKYSEKSYLKGNKLIIGEKSYTLEELEKSSEKVQTINSAPSTPTISYRNEYVEEEQNKLISKEESEESAKEEKISKQDKKLHKTPHLATHKKVLSGNSKSPPKNKNAGMKLRHK